MLNPPKSPFIKGGKLAKLIGGFFKQFLKINLTGESMQTFISKIFTTINDIIEFEAISDFIFRNIIWIMIAGFGFWFLKPQLPEIRTLLMIAVIEAIAVGLSGTAVLVYTSSSIRADFYRCSYFGGTCCSWSLYCTIWVIHYE